VNSPDPRCPSATAELQRWWYRENQRHLALSAAAVTARLVGDLAAAETGEQAARDVASDVLHRTGIRVGIETVSTLFDLTRFETSIVVAAAAPELGVAEPGGISFQQALENLPEPHWSAVLPDRPLRGWRLLTLPGSATGIGMTNIALTLDERVLHGLLGARTVDGQLAGLAELASPVCELTDAQTTSAQRLARMCASAAGGGPGFEPVVLTGEDQLTRRQVTITAGAELSYEALVVRGDGLRPATRLPEHPADRAALTRLLAREAGLGRRLLLIEAESLDDIAEFGRQTAAHGAPVVLSVPVVSAENSHSDLPRILIPPCTVADRVALLQADLSLHGRPIESDAARDLAARHALTAAQVPTVVSRAVRLTAEDGPVSLNELEEAAHSAAAQPLSGLAMVRRAHAQLSDLVLPDSALRSLHALVATVRQRERVYGEWGYRTRLRGTGVTAMFAGPSGTGKTTAAEAVAHELGRDVVAVDLSQVVSKYIGDTQKNLATLFAANEGGSVLLFDEGDALFGRRTAVRDSHDRYANLEVSYLLQRMETFDGIAIITTNTRENVDSAFTRRFRFVVNFPFPDQAQRAQLWSAAFPAGVPTEGLQPERLAQLSVSGGTISQIAMHAAFLAADEGCPVTMSHLLQAVRIECDKLERALAANEVKGWVTQ